MQQPRRYEWSIFLCVEKEQSSQVSKTYVTDNQLNKGEKSYFF